MTGPELTSTQCGVVSASSHACTSLRARAKFTSPSTEAIGVGSMRTEDPHAQARGAPGVYVADASIFPTSAGVPPQVTIMSLARLIADHIADELPA